MTQGKNYHTPISPVERNLRDGNHNQPPEAKKKYIFIIIVFLAVIVVI